MELIIYDYFQNSDNDVLYRKDIWSNYFALTRKNKNLTMGKKQLWNNVEGKFKLDNQNSKLGPVLIEFMNFMITKMVILKDSKKNNIDIDVDLDYTVNTILMNNNLSIHSFISYFLHKNKI